MFKTQYVTKIKDHLVFGALSFALAASAVGVTAVASAVPAHARASFSVDVNQPGDDGNNPSGTLESLGPTAADQGASLFRRGQEQSAIDLAQQQAAFQSTTYGVDAAATGVFGAILTALPVVATPSSTDPAWMVQDMNRRMAQLGASGVIGYVAGEATSGSATAGTPIYGGVANVSPALASQLYDQSTQGSADQVAALLAARAPGLLLY
jgi:hypothetical protein